MLENFQRSRCGIIVPLLFLFGIASGQNAKHEIVSAGQLPIRSSPKRPKLDPELQSTIDLITGVPPEFGADVLMKVVESSKLVDPVVKMQLLKRAFNLASSSEQPIHKRVVLGGAADTTSGVLGYAFELNLDRISLQSRAVTDMLPMDSVRARVMFENIEFPVLPPLHCDESLFYYPLAFYRTLDVVSHTFTRKEKLEGHRLAWLMPYVSNIQSHAQVAPIAQVLSSPDLSDKEVDEAVIGFANTLQQLRGDERSFASAMVQSGESGPLYAVEHLVETLDSRGISAFQILNAFRDYVVSNFRGPRCAETFATETKNTTESIKAFNEIFREALRKSHLAPISEDELQGSKIAGKALYHPFWQSLESERLLLGVQKLRYGEESRNALTHNSERTFAWSAQLSDYLTELSSWNGTGETESDFFHEKSILYEALVDIMPLSTERMKVLDSYMEFLEQSSLQQASPIEWFFHAHGLLTGSRAPDYHLQVLRSFRNSSNPILSLYARVESCCIPKLYAGSKGVH